MKKRMSSMSFLVKIQYYSVEKKNWCSACVNVWLGEGLSSHVFNPPLCQEAIARNTVSHIDVFLVNNRNPVQMFTKLSSLTKREHANLQQSSDIYITFHFLLMILFEFKSLLERHKLKHEKRSNGRKKCVMCDYIQYTFRNISNCE